MIFWWVFKSEVVTMKLTSQIDFPAQPSDELRHIILCIVHIEIL